MKRRCFPFILFLLFALYSCNTYQSPGPITSADSLVYVALTGDSKISVLSSPTGKVIDRFSIPGPVHGILAQEDKLYVAYGEAAGMIDVIARDGLKKEISYPVGHTPVSIARKGDKIYVANRFSATVSVINTNTGEQKQIEVIREPKSLQVTPGNRLIVANFLPASPSTSGHVAAEISIIDTEKEVLIGHVSLPNGSQSVEDIALSPDGKYAYFTHLISRYGLPITQLDRGWVNSNCLSVMNLDSLKIEATLLLDDVDCGAANPKGIVATPSSLYIAVSGTHELMEIDRVNMHERIDSVLKGEHDSTYIKSIEELKTDLSFLKGIKKRYSLSSLSPQDITLCNGKLYVSCRFTPTVEVFDGTHLETIYLGSPETMNSERRGEFAFQDASLCYQGWQSCASCHPDGRMDGLNWDQLNDGMGNPKNTKSMLFSHVTPPSMITGIRESAEVAVRKGITHILGTEPDESTASDIDAYLKSLTPVESPHRINGRLTPSAKKGKRIFEQAGCAECHSGKYYTDQKKHDVGIDPSKTLYDTPTLHEIWRTAPYLYDGRALTIQEVLTQYNQEDKHGKTSNLNQEELNHLTEYILSL